MRSARGLVFALAVFVMAYSLGVQAEPANRIRQAIDSRQTVSMWNVHPLARPEFDQGALDPSQIVQRVTIVFNRSAAQEQALEKLLDEQQDPSSPNYHNWLTPEQFAAQFGMSDADLTKVRDWLTSKGFVIDEVARGRDFIKFSGSVGQINSAFLTEMHQYDVRGDVHFANATPLAIPASLAHVIAGIRSLNNFKPKPRVRRVKPDFTSSLSGNNFVAPDDFATIYNLNALYAEGIDGTGQKIAVVGQTDLYSSGGDPAADITTFRNVSNLPNNPPKIILIPGPDPGLSTQDIGEASLDVEWSGAVARNATIIYVNSGTSGGVFDSLYYAIDNKVAPVISISYGLCEAQETNFENADEAELQKAASQGQSVVGPAGDSGAADCDTNYPVTDGVSVDFPASSPYVTGVGGTTFSETNGITYWSITNDVSQGSALFYIPETTWNDSSAGSLSSTGGGASIFFSKPSWQPKTGILNDGKRDVPDVAFAASPDHDGYITCVQGDCQICVTTDANCPTANSPGYRLASNQDLDIVGGTSAGAPTFAGLIALVNQKTGSTQGDANPKLYQLSSTAPYVFHDITTGDNKVQCSAGPGCPNGGGTIGFSAMTGYDQTTGLGTPDGFNLVANWNTTAAADFGISVFNSTINVAPGDSGNMLVIVRKQNGFSGTVNLSCTSPLPNVSCSVSPSAVTPDATATVTVTVSASGSLRSPSPSVPWWTSAFGVAAIFGIGNIGRKKRAAMVLAFLLALLMVMVACGGNLVRNIPTAVVSSNAHPDAQGSDQTGADQTSATTTPSRPDRGARPAQSSVSIQATSGSLSHSAQLFVTLN